MPHIEVGLYLLNIDSTPDLYGETNEKKFYEARKRFEKFDFLNLAEFNVEGLEKPHWYNNPLIVNHNNVVVTKDQLADLAVAGVRFTVTSEHKAAVDISQALMEWSDKPALQLNAPDAGHTYNNRCEVHIAGQALSLYNETELMEDACTDALQDKLNNGYRIIAACPQPDQRRPDYILGRYNPEARV